MARLLCPVRSMATRSGTFARIRLRAAVRRQSWRKRVGTPAAWQAVRHAVRQRRIVIPSRWKTSGLSGSRRARRRFSASAMGGEMGRMRPTNVFERAGASRITPPAASISSTGDSWRATPEKHVYRPDEFMPTPRDLVAQAFREYDKSEERKQQALTIAPARSLFSGCGVRLSSSE